jgi:hypothetical protein
MTTRPHPASFAHLAHAHTAGAVERAPGILDRWQTRRAERKTARLISARNRRILATRLRRAANHAIDPDPVRRRHDVLLHYRAAAVRTDLLEIAALLERARDPDPECITVLQTLLANHTADSPLYNPHTPFAELEAILDKVRTGLLPVHSPNGHLRRTGPNRVAAGSNKTAPQESGNCPAPHEENSGAPRAKSRGGSSMRSDRWSLTIGARTPKHRSARRSTTTPTQGIDIRAPAERGPTTQPGRTAAH